LNYIGYFVYPLHDDFGGAEVRAIEFEKQFNKLTKENNIDIKIKRVLKKNDLDNIEAIIIYGGHYKNHGFLQYIKSKYDLTIITSSVFVKNAPSFLYYILSRIKKIKTTPRITYEIYNESDWIFTNTEYEKEDLIHSFKLSSDNIVVLPNMINQSSILKMNYESYQDIVEEKKVKDSIICVGRIEPIKNQVFLIESVLKYDLDTHIIFIGSKNYEHTKYTKKFKHLIQQHPNKFTYVGKVNQNVLFNIMDSSKGLILPSLFETTGRVALEAYILGIPLALSNLPTIKEYISKKENVIYFESKKSKSIVDAINKINQGTLGRRNYRQNVFYSYENGLEKYINFFKKVLNY
jgi:glycosyltransferase involved in cell wall biosynthesis